MLRLYLDESGDRDDPGLQRVSVGGVLGPIDAWAEFEAKWTSVLHEFRVSELHMTDLVSKRGEFAGWTDARCDEFLGRVLESLERAESVLVPVGRVSPVLFYREAKMLSDSDRWSSQQRHLAVLLGEDPIVTCFRDVVCVADDEIAVRWGENEKAKVVFDKPPKGKRRALKNAYTFVTQLRPALVGDLDFRCSKETLPLQLADFVAYEVAKHVVDPEWKPETYRRLRKLASDLPA